ncbi:MAG: hypothetical protein A3C30_02070 [Candidatus Levybacteria bacterium RIFCSPHIGHO2_02_FULL_40_18]|nr:MAG: hypothetical protein A2869_04450 [Candidatus Levybacteria bacterium RIFCSPHIGHO2_01_FULL_40_58]OGH26776.1 MAG: hypothetical protein A3C30_02070 [Candidatus Levybacteria bacterium RIFCSPHIGHO2_02_FULL_40_18]OGH31711.1 MAG: hypothetical protein A3E43_01790 [Candidatus Levybacteria bacterium RIFCSPHIGHO2_12_FULL_40_31]OGH40611.1 MAG: hypothetical protein A2894_00340 [Candidatus Levybacteria bacterium RIFCSPLOWO2_01_FULL_40_64]OGH48784.1 MAG: hypothetical protein A3I54_03965 [Candidatus Lev
MSIGIFISTYLSGINLIITSIFLSFLGIILLYFTLRSDISGTFYYPILILPFFFTISFSLFYPLIPARLLTRIIVVLLYAFGLYSLFLTQNIFAVSAIRTITLLRSARIVSFVLTIVVLFLLTNIIFSLRLSFFITPIVISILTFLLNFQSLWVYSLSREFIRESFISSLLVSLALGQLAFVLNLWPVTAAIYSIFITGIFYAYSGLTHAWIEKRLFKGILWEYVWVGFLAILILVFFSNWGF